MNKSLEEIRRDTPACQHRIHLNSAGASLTPTPVQQVVIDHLTLEQEIGPYEAEKQQEEKLESVYRSLARLVGAKPNEIAVTQNATRAWDMLFYGLDLKAGDTILTCRAEYASNYLSFLQRSQKTGCSIRVIDNDDQGAVCLDSLQKNLDDSVKVVAINHIPTNGGLVQPVVAIGELLKDHPAFYLVDGCQSAGQLPIDVAEIGCDGFTATGRKYLRGPRGVGFLYVDEHKLRDIEPPMIDLHSAVWESKDSYRFRDDAKRFETWEVFVAGKLGLGAAADYAMAVGLEASWQRLRGLAEIARQELQAIPGVSVHDLGEVRGGIVTFTVDGVCPTKVQEELSSQWINVWSSSVRSALLDMEARGLQRVVRASFHYYNNEFETGEFLSAVQKMRA